MSISCIRMTAIASSAPLPSVALVHLARKSSIFHTWSRIDSQSRLAISLRSLRNSAYRSHDDLVTATSSAISASASSPPTSILNASASFCSRAASSWNSLIAAANSSMRVSTTAGLPLGPCLGLSSAQRLPKPPMRPRKSSSCLAIVPASCTFCSSRCASNCCSCVVNASHWLLTSPMSTTAYCASLLLAAIARSSLFFSSMRRRT
mmetsp:Transcript_6110/g.18916  ORF Transcript_6110/g.18916 Transcript_6110/m.18916 type:complete len:206 (+) Transcript_6110:469-1086(+)